MVQVAEIVGQAFDKGTETLRHRADCPYSGRTDHPYSGADPYSGRADAGMIFKNIQLVHLKKKLNNA